MTTYTLLVYKDLGRQELKSSEHKEMTNVSDGDSGHVAYV
jgi:hypothetical protein